MKHSSVFDKDITPQSAIKAVDQPGTAYEMKTSVLVLLKWDTNWFN